MGNQRNKFIQCCEAIFRELGFPPPAMTHDEGLPLVMELEYCGNQFEISHSPSDMPTKALICCVLGAFPDSNTAIVLKNILSKNLMLRRAHQACLGVSAEKNIIACMYYEAIESWGATAWLEKMKATAIEAIYIKNYCIANGQGQFEITGNSKSILLA